MNRIITIFEHEGYPIRVEDGTVYLRAFGTSVYNHNMHWSWVKTDIKNIKPEIVEILRERGLL